MKEVNIDKHLEKFCHTYCILPGLVYLLPFGTIINAYPSLILISDMKLFDINEV